MPEYRATSMGQHPDGSGKRIREGEKLSWDFGSRGPPKWLEQVEVEASPAPAAEAESQSQTQSEPAEAPESKRNLRSRKVAKGAD